MTKEKRKEMFGSVGGGSGSMGPEKYQREQVMKGTGRPCPPTNMRINMRRGEMKDIAHPFTTDDGFEWSEDFDGMQNFSSNTVWVNFKSVVESGGAQTRTLRCECYAFVKDQLNYLLTSKNTDTYFANIFDGLEAASRMRHFQYLLGLPEFASVKQYVYVGDLKGYFGWVKATVCQSDA
jgi:hypothetical protein